MKNDIDKNELLLYVYKTFLTYCKTLLLDTLFYHESDKTEQFILQWQIYFFLQMTRTGHGVEVQGGLQVFYMQEDMEEGQHLGQ